MSINLRDGGYFIGTVPDGKRVNACVRHGSTYEAPMLHIQAHWQGMPQCFGSAYTCAIGDTVTSGGLNGEVGGGWGGQGGARKGVGRSMGMWVKLCFGRRWCRGLVAWIWMAGSCGAAAGRARQACTLCQRNLGFAAAGPSLPALQPHPTTPHTHAYIHPVPLPPPPSHTHSLPLTARPPCCPRCRRGGQHGFL